MNNPSNKLISCLEWSDQGKASLWRYVVGAVLAILVFFMLDGIGLIPLALLLPNYKDSLPLSVVGILLSFVVPFFVIPLIVRVIHLRSSWDVALTKWRFETWKFLTGICVNVVVSLVTALLFSVVGLVPIEWNPDFRLPVLLPVVLLGLTGIFIQKGSEEMLFRGYFTQFARRFTANKYVFIGIPALLFALPHIANIVVLGSDVLVALPYLISGILIGWTAYKSGPLWMSLGLQLANNYTSLVLIGNQRRCIAISRTFPDTSA